MTLDEALTLREGQYIASPHDNPAFRVRRVTETWQNADATICRVKLASYSQQDWVDPTGFVKCPEFRVPPSGETKGTRYRLGDVLLPEHRPTRNDTDFSQEAETAGGGSHDT